MTTTPEVLLTYRGNEYPIPLDAEVVIRTTNATGGTGQLSVPVTTLLGPWLIPEVLYQLEIGAGLAPLHHAPLPAPPCPCAMHPTCEVCCVGVHQ